MPMDDDRGRGQTSAGYQGQGRGSGVTSNRPDPGGGNTGGGGRNRDRQNDSGSDSGSSTKQTAKENERRQAEANQKAADDARAKATQEAVNRDRIQAAIAEGRRQSELQRVAAGIASLRGVPLPKVQTAEFTGSRSLTDAIADQNVPQITPNTFSTTQMSMPSGLTPTIPGGMMADQKNRFDFGYTDPTSTAMRMQGDTERNLSNLNTLDPSFQTKLSRTLDDTMNAGIGGVTINSGLRSPMEQASIIADRLNKVDSNLASQWSRDVLNLGPEAAGQKYKALFDQRGLFSSPGQQVAMPGESRHQMGTAADMAIDGRKMDDISNPDVAKFRELALQSGLNFPVAGEAWHVEPVGDRPVENQTASVGKYVGDQIASAGKFVVDAGKSVVDAITNAPGNTLKALNEAFDSTPQVKALEDQNRLAGGLTKEEYAKKFGVDPSKVQSRIVDYGQGQQVDYYSKSLGDKFGEAVSDLGKGFSNAGKGLASLVGFPTGTDDASYFGDIPTAVPQTETGFGPGGDLTREQYRDQYGGRDIAVNLPPTQGVSATTPPAVAPPVDPVMPTVPNFAMAQRYTGTPTVATQGFDFSRPFAPRPSMDFANLGQAYAPTALPSASPQPLPGIPGAPYATPYQRLG